MNAILTLYAVLLMACAPVLGTERAIDKNVEVAATLDLVWETWTTRVTLHHTGWGDGGEWDKAYTYFDRAWVSVLANLKKRFEQGPQDWRPRLEQLRRSHEAAASTPSSAASR